VLSLFALLCYFVVVAAITEKRTNKKNSVASTSPAGTPSMTVEFGVKAFALVQRKTELLISAAAAVAAAMAFVYFVSLLLKERAESCGTSPAGPTLQKESAARMETTRTARTATFS